MYRNSLKFIGCGLLLAASIPAVAQETSRRASIRGGGGDWGKCTIEVEVDGVAEIAVSGDTGRMHTLAGQPSIWRRFECSGPIPARPVDFRFRGIDGRGRVELIRDPRDNRGIALVRIEDSKGGREGYTFDLEWRGNQGGGGGWLDRDNRGGGGINRDRVYGSDTRLRYDAVNICREAVIGRLENDGYRNVDVRRLDVDDRRGNRDSVNGRATARRGRDSFDFDFSCAANLENGRVRSVDVVRR